MKVTVPNIGDGEGEGKGGLRKVLDVVSPCLVRITCSAWFGCRSSNIAVFHNSSAEIGCHLPPSPCVSKGALSVEFHPHLQNSELKCQR